MAGQPPVGAILAGGAARRLGGVAKGLLEIGGERVIDRIAKALRQITPRILIVTSNAAATGWVEDAAVVADEQPGAGALAGVATALRAARSDVLVVAWDMPFVTSDMLGPLLAEGAEHDATMWRTPSGIEPLCGCYRQSALPMIEAALAGGVRRARDVASLLRVRTLIPPPASGDDGRFLSINTPADLALARRLAEAGRPTLARHA